MLKKLAKHKLLRRRYKHYAAALAGAAIMAGSSLHGIPISKASAAPSASRSAAIEQTAVSPSTAPNQNGTVNQPAVAPEQHNKNKNDRHTEHARLDQKDQRESRYDHNRYKHEKWADRRQSFRQRMAWYNNSRNQIQIVDESANAIDVVKAAADDLGFDVNYDTFILLSQRGNHSTIRVIHNDNQYAITVNQLYNGNWLISSINQIS